MLPDTQHLAPSCPLSIVIAYPKAVGHQNYYRPKVMEHDKSFNSVSTVEAALYKSVGQR